MNAQYSLALALVLLAPLAVVGDRSYNSIDQEYNSLSDSRNIISCVSGSDCGQNECSVMGMQRYSEPECQPRGGLGAPCRMYADEPENKTLHFPHVTMQCQDVYMQFCPCASGLVCREAECQQAEVPRAPVKLAATQPEENDDDQTDFFGSGLFQNRQRNVFPWALGRFH